jgi:site-specific recombinase XerD
MKRKFEGKCKVHHENHLTSEGAIRLNNFCSIATSDYTVQEYRGKTVASMVISLGLHAGLRVAEIANLKVGDCHLESSRACIIVRNSKGLNRGKVMIENDLRIRLKSFIAAKRFLGENVSNDACLILSSRNRPFTTRGIQMLVKRLAGEAGLPVYFTLRCLRHTFAVSQLFKTKNLSFVQRQLRHSNICSTALYAVMRD